MTDGPADLPPVGFATARAGGGQGGSDRLGLHPGPRRGAHRRRGGRPPSSAPTGRGRRHRPGRRGPGGRRRLDRRHRRGRPAPPGPGVCSRPAGGKGRAMAAGVEASTGDLVVFLDADVENTSEVRLGPARPPPPRGRRRPGQGVLRPRPLHGEPAGGGRVTELMARPLIEVLFPELPGVRQPLAGETAAPRWVLEKLGFAPGYGVELGLLVDVARRFGAASIAQVDLGVRDPPQPPALRAAAPGGRGAAGRPGRTGIGPEGRAVTPAPVASPRGRLRRRLQPGPAVLPPGPDGRPVRPGSGGGLAATLHPLLAGTGATWVAAAMSEADRRAVGQGPRWPRTACHRHRVADPDPYRMAYDVVVQRHLVVLPPPPLRPAPAAPLRPPLAAGLGRLPRLNAAVRRRRGRRARPRAHACWSRTTTCHCCGAMLAAARPDLRTVHFSHTPFADPSMLRVPARRRRPASCWPGWPASGPAASTPPAGRPPSGPPTPTRAGRARRRAGAAATFVAPLGPGPRAILAAEADSPAVGRAARRLDEVVGGGAADAPSRPGRALQEPRSAGFWAFEELLESRPEWRGEVVWWPWPTPRGRDWPTTSPTAPRSSTPRPGSTTASPSRAGPRWCSTWPTTGPARWPPSPATTCCWSTRCATA